MEIRPFLWIRKLNIATIPLISKLIKRFSVIPIKIPQNFLMCENWQKILKFVLKFNVPRMSETFLKKKNHVRKTFQQGIKTWYNVVLNKWCGIGAG